MLVEWGQVFTFGETKYGRDNWRGGTAWHEFYGSAFRHLLKFWAGEDNDDCDDSQGCAGAASDFCPIHSRLPHLAHTLWNVGAIRYYQLHGLGVDDRPRTSFEEPPLDAGSPQCQHVYSDGPDAGYISCVREEGHEGRHAWDWAVPDA